MENEQPTNTPDTQPASASNVGAPELVTAPEPTPGKPVAALPEGKHRRHGLGKLLAALLLLVIVAAALLVGYVYGKHNSKAVTTSTAGTMASTAFAVPKGAAVLEQCMPGLGTQYILPKDIPQGPVYNVYQGKVTGIQYMLSSSSLSSFNSTIGDLQLFNQKYDHVDVMSMPAHAGFPAPHYEIDVMSITHAQQDKITCGASGSGSGMQMPGMSGMSGKSM